MGTKVENRIDNFFKMNISLGGISFIPFRVA